MDDVLVTEPSHRSVCRYCCPTHDELRAEVELLRREIMAEHQRNNGSEVVVGHVTEHERSMLKCQYPLCKALNASLGSDKNY